METTLGRRVHDLVDLGWEPTSMTETTASLTGRRPFNWWLFLFVLFFFPLFGGLFYLVFYLATSKATVFLHAEADGLEEAGDTWLVKRQQTERDALIAKRKQIKERGFLAVMWPQLLVSLLLLALWLYLIKAYLAA